jgi:ankyrin repeat protein
MNNIDCKIQDAQGQTALHLSCIIGDLESYKLIVSHNYQIKNCVDKASKQPLMYAEEKKHKAIIEYDKTLTITLYAKNAKDFKTAEKFKPEDFEFVMPLGKGAFGEVVLVQY